MLHHPDLEKLPPKDPTRCLAAAVHYVLRFRLFKNNPSQGTTADKFQVEWKKFYQAITGKMYDAGKKTLKALKMKKDQADTEKPTKGTRKTRSSTIRQSLSLPDPFTPIDPKKAKTLDTKEDQAEDTATQTSEVMDMTDIPELISDEEEDEPTKQFTLKHPTGNRRHCK